MTHRDIKTDVRMESHLTETLKSVIMVVVTLSIMISSLVTLWLLRKSKTNTDDVTAPLVTSVFTSGLVVGFLCLLACLINWFNLQQHPFVLYLYIYLLVLGFYMNFIFVAILTSLKLLAILKPFLYKRTVTCKILKNITFIKWGATMCIISPLVAWFSSPQYNPVMKTVQMTGKYSLVFSKVIFYSTSMILIVTSVCFFIAVVRHRIKMKTLVLPVTVDGTHQQQTHAVLSAIWAYKGILLLSFTRIALNLPFYIMLEMRLLMINSAFFAIWAILSIFILDAIGYVLFTANLRNLLCKNLHCNKKDHTVTSTVNTGNSDLPCEG